MPETIIKPGTSMTAQSKHPGTPGAGRGFAATLCALLLSACGAADTLPRIDDGDPVAGKALYAANCAACHGVELEGQPDWRTRLPNGLLPAPPHDESGHTWHHDDVLLFEYTKFGGADAMRRRGVDDLLSGMPPFSASLSDQQILDVLAYIRSTWSAEIKDIQASRNRD